MRPTVQAALALGVLLAIPQIGSAQDPPQDGTFVLICSMHGEADSGGGAWHRDDACSLPGDFPIDKTHRQPNLSPAGGGATSDITTADVPSGLHLKVPGNHYWSIVKPIGMVILDQDGPIVRQFKVHTYCGPAGWPGPGCSVHVDVYARKKK